VGIVLQRGFLLFALAYVAKHADMVAAPVQLEMMAAADFHLDLVAAGMTDASFQQTYFMLLAIVLVQLVGDLGQLAERMQAGNRQVKQLVAGAAEKLLGLWAGADDALGQVIRHQDGVG